MSNHSRRQQKKHSHTPLRVINLFLLVIFILLSVVSLFLMYRHHFLVGIPSQKRHHAHYLRESLLSDA